MSKQIKMNKQSKASTMSTADKAQKMWLAGLGAFSIAQKQSIVMFESMVSEGKAYQASSEKIVRKVSKDVQGMVESRMKPVKLRLKAIRNDAEAKLEKGVGRAMSYVGIPSKADVDALIARVDKLSRQLRAAK